MYCAPEHKLVLNDFLLGNPTIPSHHESNPMLSAKFDHGWMVADDGKEDYSDENPFNSQYRFFEKD